MNNAELKVQESADALLLRFLGSSEASAKPSVAGREPISPSLSSPEVSSQQLEMLITRFAEPVIRKITRFKLCSPFSASQGYDMQDEEDVRSNVILQLISRLRDLKKSPGATPIGNFEAYVAGITYNSCNRLLRMKYPARWRLKNRLRYLLSHQPGFTLWENEHKEWLCGLTAWPHNQARQPGNHEASESDLASFIGSLSGEDVSQMKPARLVNALLRWRGEPMLLENLVKMVAYLCNIQDLQMEARPFGDEDASICDLLPDPKADVASQVEKRFFLEKLWTEICELPVRQRIALLLNLRDSRESDALVLFILTGIASMHRIAAILEIPLKEFAALWNELPLDDLSIAERLTLSRQQVINLRKSARERLARRMAAH